MTPGIYFEHLHLSYEAIQAGDFDSGILTEDQQELIHFSQQWLRGQKEFTLQTSGSTGKPKSITVSRSLMEISAARTIAALHLKTGDHALLCLPTRYIAGKMMLVRAMECSMAISIRPASGNPLAGWPETTAIDFTAFIPYQMEQVLANPHTRSLLSHVDKIILGGGATSASLKASLQELKSRVYATYGMTETVSHVALQKLNGEDRQDYFHALGDVRFSQDARNCLIIEGYGGPPLISNDVVELPDPYRFRWKGRADFVINSGGIKLQPETIETTLAAALPALSQRGRWLLSSRPHAQLGEELVLVVEGTEETALPEATIMAASKKALSRYEQPRAIVYMERFPLTPTGKVKRAEIKRWLNSQYPLA